MKVGFRDVEQGNQQNLPCRSMPHCDLEDKISLKVSVMIHLQIMKVLVQLVKLDRKEQCDTTQRIMVDNG